MKSPSLDNWFHRVGKDEDLDEPKFLVAVNPDDRGQDTLNFVFSKLVEKGDHVTILHVLDKIPDLPQLPDRSLDQTEAVETAWLEAHKHQAKQQLTLMLQNFRSFCEKNLILVNFHFIRSKNAKETILHETVSLRSSFLILGSVAKSTFTGKHSKMSSTAKYCVKNCTSSCTVMVVASGSVICTNQKESPISPTGNDYIPRQLSLGSRTFSGGKSLADVGRAFSEASGKSGHLRASSIGRALTRKLSKSHFSPLLEVPSSPTFSSSSSLSSRNEEEFNGGNGPDLGGFHSSTFSYSNSGPHPGAEYFRTLTEVEKPRKKMNEPGQSTVLPETSSSRDYPPETSRLSSNSSNRVENSLKKSEVIVRPPLVLSSSARFSTGVPSPFSSSKWGPGGVLDSGFPTPRGLRSSYLSPGTGLVPSQYGWDDNVVGVKPLSRQGSLTKAMAELAHVSTNHEGSTSRLHAIGLAAASGLARQGSGIPSARMAALEISSMDPSGTVPSTGAVTGAMNSTASGVGAKGNVNSPNSVIHSGGLFSGSLKSLSGSFHSLMAEKQRQLTEEGLMPLSVLLSTCSGGSAHQSVQPVPSLKHKEGHLEPSGGSFGVKFFHFEEISEATNHFSPENLVGKGGFAEVFKGTLKDGSKVAVKRLFQKKKSEIEFLTEVGIVSHVKHPNATRLMGYSIDESNRLLVYELLAHGSLDRNLHRKYRKTLDWDRRLKAAIGSAKGLQYLHHDCPRRIIHRDVKSANILLGDDYEAQICDFGLAKWIPERGAFSSLGPIEGTFGYMAPEYFMHGELNEKTDVYAFGIVLLEIITGRRPIEASKPQLEQNLHSWALPFLTKADLTSILDPRLKKSSVDMASLRRMCAAALFCLRYIPDNRPSMGEVAQLLEDKNLSDELLEKLWPSIVEGRPELSLKANALEDVVNSKEYTQSMYYRDMQQHMAVALANPEGLVRST